MHADIARQAFERTRQRDQFLVFLVARHRVGKGRFLLQRAIQRPRIGRVVRNQLRQLIALGVRQVEHAAGVAHDGFCSERAEGRDLRHGIGAVLALHVVDHSVAVVLAEVDVEVRHRHALRIQEALEQQSVAQRIEIGDAQRVRNQRAGSGTSSGADRNPVLFRPVDEVGNDQEVAGKTHLRDSLELEVEARLVLGAPCSTRALVREERLEPALQPCRRKIAAVIVERHARRRRVARQLRLAKFERQVAAARDLGRVRQSRWHVDEKLFHLGAAS